MLILDTNTVSYYLRGDTAVVNKLRAIAPSDVSIPAIVEYELRYGFERLPEQVRTRGMARLTDVLQALQVLPFDSDCAQQAARIRAALEADGSPIGPHDILIAATALRYGGTLVTRNTREFSRVAGLQWQNWHENA
ncbi:MAG: type II toxin-antitoxin system VapC family toxin [Burkholderiales bacterium]|nr:MAG: type II toxin-antitoxin system VapC family toxin [Burkholderiales bacterium]